MSRKLDAAIAELLGTANTVWFVDKDGERIKINPSYSTDGNAMLELDREMRERRYFLNIISWGLRYEAIYHYQNEHNLIDKAISPFTDTIPFAVALAAYGALTGKKWMGVE